MGRDEELALLSAVVGGEQGSLVVAGEMGVGKSRLVADMLDRGRVGGAGEVRVVQVRATRSTATIPFGPFARWAPAPSGPTGDRLGALQAISRGLIEEADRSVVAVDDAHLLDDGSAALVLHLVTHTPTTVVATVRSGERCPDAVTALWKEGLAARIDLQALSEPETVELVEGALGGRVDLAAGRRVWDLTRGIPLYVREVVAAGVDAGVLHQVDGIWRWRGDLAVAGRLTDLVGERLARPAGDERTVVEMLAFGEPLPVAVVDQLGLHDALAAAERDGLVVVDDGPAARLVHPLYAEVLRATVPSLTAADHQRRLAEAATEAGLHEQDPLRVASWWLASGTVPDAPVVFLPAARRALALGEWRLAERMGATAERAGAGPRAALVRSTALDLLGRWDEAEELLAPLTADAVEGDVLAEASVARAGLALLTRGDLDAALSILGSAAGRLAGPARARVVAHAGFLAVSACRPAEALEHATAALADAGDDTGIRVGALSVAALARVVQGRVADAIETAEATLPDVPAVVATDPNPVALNATGVMPVAYALALVVEGRLAEAADVAEVTLGAASTSDFRILHGITAALHGRMVLFQGRVALARRRGEEGVAIIRELQAPFEWPAAVAAMAAAQLGDVAAASAALAWLDEAPRAPVGVYDLEVRQGRAWLLAAQGDLSAARAELETVTAMAADAGAPLFELLALTDLVRLGGAGAAAARLATVADEMCAPYPAAVAAFATALASGDGDGLDATSARFEAMGFDLLAAEAAAGAASTHRLAGRRGSHLTALGRARLLAARCDDPCTPGLRDLDAEPALATLTGREREVVELAARGLSNRAIADRLVVSVRTVHTHLHRAYAKLGVNDRDQLASILRG